MNSPLKFLADLPAQSQLSRRHLLQGAVGATALPLLQSAQAAGELPSGAELWKWVRAQQMLNINACYLDTAAVGPSWRAVLASEYRAEEAFNSDPGSYARGKSAALWRTQLERLGRWLDCSADELCLTTGTAEALSMVANGLDLAAGDEIVTTTHEHAAALAPWLLRAKRQGIVVKQVQLPSPLTGPEQALGLMAGAVTERTRVMAFCHVQATDGAVLPVRELCAFARQRNILSVVDGALALGALQFSVRELGCDFYAASLHKWINGPYGAGLLYVHPIQLEQLWPLSSSADEMDVPGWPKTLVKLGTAYKYFAPRWQALDTALNFQEQIGRERVETRLRELTIYAKLRLQQLPKIEILTPSHPAMWGPVMSFRVAADPNELAAKLAREYNVIVGAVRRTERLTALRTSLHIYNSHDDIERLLQALQRLRV